MKWYNTECPWRPLNDTIESLFKRNDCLNHRFSETISCWEVIQELIRDLHLLMFDIFCQGGKLQLTFNIQTKMFNIQTISAERSLT